MNGRSKFKKKRAYLAARTFTGSGTKSLVELQRLAACRLFEVGVNEVFVTELPPLVRPFPVSEIKLLN